MKKQPLRGMRAQRVRITEENLASMSISLRDAVMSAIDAAVMVIPEEEQPAFAMSVATMIFAAVLCEYYDPGDHREVISKFYDMMPTLANMEGDILKAELAEEDEVRH